MAKIGVCRLLIVCPGLDQIFTSKVCCRYGEIRPTPLRCSIRHVSALMIGQFSDSMFFYISYAYAFWTRLL
ncbi:hypothetical protein F4803DRAFT_524559 [Xylaria telfairii]|nr:hypothetical protein F4803DRAFT_524559 [Xylaria telfairii]